MSGLYLKYFADAKVQIGKLGSSLHDLVLKQKDFLKIDPEVVKEMMQENTMEELDGCLEKLQGVMEMVKRNRMKVVFFGRTSNGKSTVINAMLKKKILPSGLGHTTNCFVQVEGYDGREGVISTEDGHTHSVSSLKELASALSANKLSSDQLIRLQWPKNQCKSLQHDVVFVDSPGIDVSADVDKWIDKFCLDADVFVLVVNAESTLMQTEKNFFHKVSTRLSKPNIFIVNNRWDASSQELDSIHEVKQQHLQRCGDFLTTELQCTSPTDLPHRIFFTSAQEVLTHTSQEWVKDEEGCMERLRQFQDFERDFEECISKTAVETKFSHHVCMLHEMNEKLMCVWQDVHKQALEHKSVKLGQLHEAGYQLSCLRDNSTTSSDVISTEIINHSSELCHRMHKILTYELDNLSSIIDDFNKPFNPHDSQMTNNYKRELSFHVEECLTRNLHLRFTPLARHALHHLGDKLIEGIGNMVSEERRQELMKMKPARDFEVIYSLDCPKLCAPFQPDLRFHFSLGLNSLLQRFTGTSLPDDEWGILLKTTSSSSSILPFTSPSSISTLSLLALATRAIGMRVLMTCVLLYVMLYVYERATWTDRSRREAYKEQYRKYARCQLDRVANIMCASCSGQVQTELEHLHRSCMHLLGEHEEEVEEKIEGLRSGVERLDNIACCAQDYCARHEKIRDELLQIKRSYGL